MIDAVRYLRDGVGIPLAEALRMASLYPAEFLRDLSRGRIVPGARADLVWIDACDRLAMVWVDGQPYRGEDGLRASA